jgi:tetratricopeptide (TPR) repeat protein
MIRGVTVAFALYCKGKVLDDAGRLDEALNVFKRVIEDYGDIAASGLWSEVLAGALYSMGFTLGRLDESEAAVACYLEVIGRFGTDADPQVQRLAARAVYQVGDSEGAIEILDQVNTDYGTDADPELRLLAIQALTAQGTELRKLGRSEEAIATYTQVIDTCAASSDPVLVREATAARFNIGVALRALNRPEEAIATYQRLIDDHSADPELRETVAMALVDMATVLGMAGRADDAITACQRVIDEYGADSTQGLPPPSPVLMPSLGCFDASASGLHTFVFSSHT